MVDTGRLTQLRDSVDLRLPEGPLAVALSGGADSGALAWLVLQTGRQTTAIHIDHGLTHSPTMRQAAVETADHLGVDLEIVQTRVEPGPSPEGQARDARYRAFNASSVGGAILTAHTADDNLETVLINLIRGTGTRGLSGIPRFRPPNIHRPLLKTSRSQLREIAVLAGIPYVDDPMNQDPSITRNRLRTTVIPRLRELNPSILESITTMTERTETDADALDSLVPTTPAVVDGAVRIPIGDLLALPVGLADRYLMNVLESLGVGSSRDRIDRLRSVLTGSAGSEQVAGGLNARRSGPFLIVGVPPQPVASRIVLTPGQHHHAGLVLDVIEFDVVCRVAPISRWHAVFPTGAELEVGPDRLVTANGEDAWIPGEKRLPVAWYQPGKVGYLSVFAREESGWTSSP